MHQKTSNLDVKQESYDQFKVAALGGGRTGGGRRGGDFPVTGTCMAVYPLNYTLYDCAAAAQIMKTQRAAVTKKSK